MVALADSMTGDHPARPVLVVSNDPNAGGLQKARDMGIDVAAVNHRDFADRPSFEAVLHDTIIASGADMICQAGFMRILTAGFTDKWAGKSLNIHPSLLPLHKGLHTHARALEAGDKTHGCTVHEVTADLDDGPILGQSSLTVRADDTPDTLAARVLKLEHKLYPAVLRRFVTGDRTPILPSEMVS